MEFGDNDTLSSRGRRPRERFEAECVADSRSKDPPIESLRISYRRSKEETTSKLRRNTRGKHETVITRSRAASDSDLSSRLSISQGSRNVLSRKVFRARGIPKYTVNNEETSRLPIFLEKIFPVNDSSSSDCSRASIYRELIFSRLQDATLLTPRGKITIFELVEREGQRNPENERRKVQVYPRRGHRPARKFVDPSFLDGVVDSVAIISSRDGKSSRCSYEALLRRIHLRRTPTESGFA